MRYHLINAGIVVGISLASNAFAVLLLGREPGRASDTIIDVLVAIGTMLCLTYWDRKRGYIHV